MRIRPRLESSSFHRCQASFRASDQRPTLHVEGAPFNLDSSGVSMVFSCSTVACSGGSHSSSSHERECCTPVLRDQQLLSLI